MRCSWKGGTSTGFCGSYVILETSRVIGYVVRQYYRQLVCLVRMYDRFKLQVSSTAPVQSRANTRTDISLAQGLMYVLASNSPIKIHESLVPFNQLDWHISHTKR